MDIYKRDSGEIIPKDDFIYHVFNAYFNSSEEDYAAYQNTPHEERHLCRQDAEGAEQDRSIDDRADACPDQQPTGALAHATGGVNPDHGSGG